jgi:hypothetical protein
MTAAQLVALCTETAKCPGFTVQAGVYLNSLLSDLCQTYDLELAAKTFYGNFDPGLHAQVGNSIYGSGPYSLPADFLRWKDDKSFFWTLPGTGVTYPEIFCDLSEFDMMVQQAGTQSYPYIIATDQSLGDMSQQGLMDSGGAFYVYAPPSGAYPYQGRYYSQMPDLSSPESSSVIPWFPNQGYLIKKLTAFLMGLVDDERQPTWETQADKALLQYLQMKDNRSTRASTVKMDRRRFGRAYTTLPNTKTVGWAVALALLGGTLVGSLSSLIGAVHAAP